MSTRKLDDKTVFNAARKIDSADNRRAYLQEACRGDVDQLDRVASLLREFERGSQFLESPVIGLHATFGVAQSLEQLNTQIGPYKIREQLGEGGMGVVYVAQQLEPVRRKVALKIIKPGMDSKQVIARFEAERQALAMMSHPNIAKVLDGGMTAAGRPYFVMELVRGVPITEFCDQKGLSVRERLELFITVCYAVQHAHLKGIIHRDLKPSNVLVELHDVAAVPKVIDFGVAKATNQELTQKTVYTHYSQMVGTPLYMSPEQAELSGLDIDTRSDIYSLGVILYELLTGITPFSEDTLSDVGLDEMRRIIREDEPSRPSKRISTLRSEQLSTISERRNDNSQQLSTMMRRELDWVVMKALEKDRSRRYETASSLAQDVQRYLDDEPVEAYPPSASYRLRKLAARHATVLTASALVAIALVVGTIVSLWQARVANQARQFAEDQSIELKRQRDRADESAEQARKNLAFSRQLVYAGDMRLAAQAREAGDIRHYTDLLDRHSMAEGEAEPCGFEWRYLRQLGTANFRTIAESDEGWCSLRHSPDGRFLAAGRADGAICVWDGRGNKQLATLRGHVDLVRGLDFLPDGSRLVSIGDDGMIRFWDLENFEEAHCFEAFGDRIGFQVFYALSGNAVVAIGEAMKANFWAVESGEMIGAFSESGIITTSLAVSPDGQSFVVGEQMFQAGTWTLNHQWPLKSVRVPLHEDYHAGAIRFPLPGESPRCLEYSQDGSIIAAGTDENLIRLYGAQTGNMTKVLAGHDDDIQDIAFHPTDRIMASCDKAGVIRTWTLDDQAETYGTSQFENWPVAFQGHSARAWSLEFSPDGRQLVSVSKDGTIRAWTAREEPRRKLSVAAKTTTFSPTGDELIIVDEHAIQIWNRFSQASIRFGESFDEEAISVDVSPDGMLIATGHDDGCIRLWNRATGQIAELLIGHEGTVDEIAFSPDSKRLVSASWDGTAGLWEVASGSTPSIFPVPPHCLSAAFSPDGHTLAISSEDNAMLYDAVTGERLHLLEGHQSTAACIAFSPNGRWLATGSHDRTIRVWDVATGETRHVIAAHRHKIRSVTFSPDGRTIASGDFEGVIAFSHVETGRFLFDVQSGVGTDSDRGTVRFLSFSSNGESLVATSPDNGVVLLHAPRLTTTNLVHKVPGTNTVKYPGTPVVAPWGHNLIKNPSAEFGLANWTHTEGRVTTQLYGTSEFPTASNGALNGGDRFFWGGNRNETTSTASQQISLTSRATEIDQGTVQADLSAWLGGFLYQRDHATVQVQWRNARDEVIRSDRLPAVTNVDRNDATMLLRREITDIAVPKKTRSARVVMQMTRGGKPNSRADNDAYVDNVALSLRHVDVGTRHPVEK